MSKQPTGRRRRRLSRFLLVPLVTLAALVYSGAAIGATNRAQIVGGTVAGPNDWPSTVALIAPTGNPADTQFCGGTLVNRSWVLTAAHCTYVDILATPPVVALMPTDIDVLAGAPDLTNEGTGERRRVLAIIRPANNPPLWFSFTPPSFANDVAFLQLEAPIEPDLTTPRIALMTLPTQFDTLLFAVNQKAMIAGWGSTVATDPPDPPGPRSPQLKQAEVTIQANQACTDSYGAAYNALIQICANNPAVGSDACVGDSGGPLSVKRSSGTPLLVGMVSFGAGRCGSAPTVFSRVANGQLRTFINTQLALPLPGAPTNVGAQPGVRSMTLTWTPPSPSNPAREGYEVRVLRGTDVIATEDIPDPDATGTTVTGLNTFAQGRGVPLTFEVRAISTAGQGAPGLVVAAPLPLAATFRTMPVLLGSVRTRTSITLSPGEIFFPDGVPSPSPTRSVVWEMCSADGGSCRAVPGAADTTTLTVPVAAVGRRVRATQRAMSAAEVVATVSTPLSAAVPPTLVARKSTRPTTDGRRLFLTGQFATQKGATVRVRVTTEKGASIPIANRSSRINGRIGTSRGRLGVERVNTVAAGSFRVAIPASVVAGRNRVRVIVSSRINGSAETRVTLVVALPG